MKKILLTGSGGFKVGNLVRKLIYEQGKKQPEDRYTFASVDCINGSPTSIYANKGHSLYIADITNNHILDIIFQIEKPNFVIHGAASSDPTTMLSSNILGTQNIINACVKHNIEKLLFLSTDKIYGNGDVARSFIENELPNPTSAFAASKASGELLIKAASMEQNLIYNIARVASCYGPRQSPNKLIPKTIKCILDGDPIPLHNGGNHVRDWLHVADNCSAITTILEKGEKNAIYNVSAGPLGQDFTDLEIVYEICKCITRGSELIKAVDDPITNRDQIRKSDNTKLKELGWSPGTKLRDAIKNTVEWFLTNQWALK